MPQNSEGNWVNDLLFFIASFQYDYYIFNHDDKIIRTIHFFHSRTLGVLFLAVPITNCEFQLRSISLHLHFIWSAFQQSRNFSHRVLASLNGHIHWNHSRKQLQNELHLRPRHLLLYLHPHKSHLQLQYPRAVRQHWLHLQTIHYHTASLLGHRQAIDGLHRGVGRKQLFEPLHLRRHNRTQFSYEV